MNMRFGSIWLADRSRDTAVGGISYLELEWNPGTGAARIVGTFIPSDDLTALCSGIGESQPVDLLVEHEEHVFPMKWSRIQAFQCITKHEMPTSNGDGGPISEGSLAGVSPALEVTWEGTAEGVTDEPRE